MSRNRRIILIANPQAGGLRLSWQRRAFQGLIQRHFPNSTLFFTEHKGHGTVLGRMAIKEGVSTIIACGGDGTLNECLNGFFEGGRYIGGATSLGIIPLGRGRDFARQLGLSFDVEDVLSEWNTYQDKKVDVGFIEFAKGERHYFINNAYVGLGTQVDIRSKETPAFLGSKVAYLYGVLRGFLEFKPIMFTMRADQRRVEQAVIVNLVIGNGIFFGCGMRAAPHARIDDGLLDIVAIKKAPFLKMLPTLPALYSGKYEPLDFVEQYRCRSLEVELNVHNFRMPIEADGDTVGYLPARFDLLPNKIAFKCPPTGLKK